MAEKTKVVPNNGDGDEKEACKRQKIGEVSCASTKTLSELENESFDLLDKMAMDSILCEEDDALDDVTLLVNECRNPQDTWYKYLKRIVESQGFDIEKEELPVEDLKKIPFLPIPHSNDEIIDCCKVSINNFNQKEGTDYKFLKFVKGNVRLWGPGANLYLTFEAVPENSHPSTVFQALVWTGSEPFSPYVKFVRPKALQNAYL